MSNSATEGNGGGVQSVDRALSILFLLARDGELGVTQIGAELGVHKSTAFRLVSTLENYELVEQTSERGKFQLGVGVLRLAGATTGRLDLVRESRPVTADLAARVGETVNIVLLSGRDALYVDQVSGPSTLQTRNWVGQRIPLHSTSNGKVLLAHSDADFIAEIAAAPLPGFTDHTIVDRERLLAELDVVRSHGYAVAVDELELGLTAVAAPVVGADGAVIASVSASGPTFRLNESRLPDVAAEVMDAAREISRRMGWHEPAGTAAKVSAVGGP